MSHYSSNRYSSFRRFSRSSPRTPLGAKAIPMPRPQERFLKAARAHLPLVFAASAIVAAANYFLLAR